MSLAKGFMQGWGLMDNHYRNKEQKEYRASRDAIADERYKTEDARRQSQHEQTMANLTQENELTGLKLDSYQEDKEQQRKVQNAQIEANRSSKARSDFGLETDKRDQANKEAISAFNAMAATGDFSGAWDNKAIMSSDLKLILPQEGRDAAIRVTEAFNQGNLSGAVNDLNTLFKPNLNRMAGKTKGRDGGEIRDVNIVGVEPSGDGQFKFKVNVTTDKGQYQSYISEMRTGDPKDPEKTFDPQQVIGKIGALGQLSKIMESSGMNKRIASQGKTYLNSMGLTPKTSPSASRTPAKVQEYQYIEKMFGRDALQKMIFTARSSDPMKIRETAIEQANEVLQMDDEYNKLNPQEKAAAQNNLARIFMSFMQGESSMGQTQQVGIQTQDPAQAILQQLAQMNAQQGAN